VCFCAPCLRLICGPLLAGRPAGREEGRRVHATLARRSSLRLALAHETWLAHANKLKGRLLTHLRQLGLQVAQQELPRRVGARFGGASVAAEQPVAPVGRPRPWAWVRVWARAKAEVGDQSERGPAPELRPARLLLLLLLPLPLLLLAARRRPRATLRLSAGRPVDGRRGEGAPIWVQPAEVWRRRRPVWAAAAGRRKRAKLVPPLLLLALAVERGQLRAHGAQSEFGVGRKQAAIIPSYCVRAARSSSLRPPSAWPPCCRRRRPAAAAAASRRCWRTTAMKPVGARRPSERPVRRSPASSPGRRSSLVGLGSIRCATRPFQRASSRSCVCLPSWESVFCRLNSAALGATLARENRRRQLAGAKLSSRWPRIWVNLELKEKVKVLFQKRPAPTGDKSQIAASAQPQPCGPMRLLGSHWTSSRVASARAASYIVKGLRFVFALQRPPAEWALEPWKRRKAFYWARVANEQSLWAFNLRPAARRLRAWPEQPTGRPADWPTGRQVGAGAQAAWAPPCSISRPATAQLMGLPLPAFYCRRRN